MDRYLTYHKKNRELNASEVIANVNSNVDYDFYTNITISDISKGDLMLINKYNRLESNFVPDNLIPIETSYGLLTLKSTAYNYFKKMHDDAAREGLKIVIVSPYRSYSQQSKMYKNYVVNHGKVKTDTFFARAGHSEHQAGLAIDISIPGKSIENFEGTEEFKWVKKNAHQYGFILRYPKDKEHLTGYVYEPWHYRYVGIDVATKIKEENVIFEEYYAYFVK